MGDAFHQADHGLYKIHGALLQAEQVLLNEAGHAAEHGLPKVHEAVQAEHGLPEVFEAEQGTPGLLEAVTSEASHDLHPTMARRVCEAVLRKDTSAVYSTLEDLCRSLDWDPGLVDLHHAYREVLVWALDDELPTDSECHAIVEQALQEGRDALQAYDQSDADYSEST